jgi:hypothetical protein
VLYSDVIKRLQSLSLDYLGKIDYHRLNSLLSYYFKVSYFEKYLLDGSYETFLKFTNSIIGHFGVSNSIIEQSADFQELCSLSRAASIHPKIKKFLEVTTYLKSSHKTAAIICEPAIRDELKGVLFDHNLENLKKPSNKKVNRLNLALFRNELDVIFLDREKDLELLLVDAVIYYQVPKVINHELGANFLKFFLFLKTDKRLYENEFKNDWKASIERPIAHQLTLF